MKVRSIPCRLLSAFKRDKKVEELSDQVTKVLKKIVIALLVAVAISQLALQFPQVREWITGVDRLEGIPF